jgi:hypothetical protein
MDKLTRDDLIRELQKQMKKQTNYKLADLLSRRLSVNWRSVGTTLNTFKNAVRGAFAQAHTQDYALRSSEHLFAG